MGSHHNKTLNFSHSPYKNNLSSEIDHEIMIGEFRLRYVQLMRDIHNSLGRDRATNLVKESLAIWEKISLQKINTEY